MQKCVTLAAVLCGLAIPASAYSGARITLPPNGRQTGRVPFTNECPANETFKINAQPEADWLSIENVTVESRPESAFGVTIMVSAGNRAPGTYRSSLNVVCASCAATQPPCLQDAKQYAVELTVAKGAGLGIFEPIPDVPSDSAPASAPDLRRPVPYVPPDPSAGSNRARTARMILVASGGAVILGIVALLVALRGLSSTRPRKAVLGDGEMRAETERHHIRR